MKKYFVAFAVIFSLLSDVVSASAQVVGTVVLPRVPVGLPAPVVPMTNAPLALATLQISPSALTPSLSVPTVAPAPVLRPALTSVQVLSGALSAASVQGRSQTARK